MPTETSHPIFRGLPQPIQDRLEAVLRERVVPRGQPIFDQGASPSAVYLVAEGHVKITRVTREGFESVLCVRGPGEYFCPVTALDKGPQLGTAVAIDNVRVLWADREHFFEICEASPELLSRVQSTCLMEVRTLMQRLEAFAFRSVRERLSMALIEESHKRAKSGKPAEVIRLTQQELAGLIGASRESVSRALSRMQQEGLIEVGRGRVRILDQSRLKRFAGMA